MSSKEIYIFIISTIFVQVLCSKLTENKCNEARKLAEPIVTDILDLFRRCVNYTMPSQRFLVDDLKSYVNYPSKTTVGFAPRYTNNRKFFANMISTTAFKEMLARDAEELRQNYIKKLKYCENVVLDENIMKHFYDREVDQTKIK